LRAGQGQPVTQEIAYSVKGDKVECAINNKVVVLKSRRTSSQKAENDLVRGSLP
jgi:hypothetical protein